MSTEATEDDLIEALGQSLDDIDLSARMRTVVERMGLLTLGDLVRVEPDALMKQPNLGRTSVMQVRTLIEDRLGTTWEQAALNAARQDAPQTADEPLLDPSEVRSWDDLKRAVSKEQRGVSLEGNLLLSSRMMSFLGRQGITTLGALVDVPAKVFGAAPNLGRKSVATTLEAIVAYVKRPKVSSAPTVDAEPPGLLALWQSRIARLEQVDRIVVQQRAGIGTEARSLAEVGEMLGFSRERARQIEARAIGLVSRDRALWEGVESRLRALLPDGTRSLDEIASVDPWFQDLRDEPAFGRFLFDRVFEGRLHYLTIGAVEAIGTSSEADVLASWRALDGALEKSEWPASWSTVEARVLDAAAPYGALVREHFLGRVRELVFRSATDSSLVLGYGRSKRSELEAYLRGAPGPVPVSDAVQRFGRRHLSDDVVFLQRGLITHIDRLHGFAALADEVVPQCAGWMRAHGPERQWSCDELVKILRLVEAPPDWFGPWPLAAMCARSGLVRYVGRLAVVLPEVEGERLLIVDAMVDVLQDAAAPLSETELFDRTSRKRGFRPLSLGVALQHRPFVEVAQGRWGCGIETSRAETDLPATLWIGRSIRSPRVALV